MTPNNRAPGGYVNLQELLGLNQKQGEEMGQKLLQPVQGQAQDAQSGILGAQSAFTQKRKAGTLQYQPGMTQEQAGQKMGGYYSGPQSLGEVNPNLSGQVQQASDAVKRVQSNTGRASILKQQQKQSGYGTTAANFDAYLAGAGAQPQLTDLQQRYGGLSDMLGLAEDNAHAQAAKAIADSNAAANEYRLDYEGKRPLKSSAANADQAATDAKNAAMRAQYGKQRTNPDGRVQQMSDLDWMLKSGRISTADYNRAMDDGDFYQQLKTTYG